MYFVRYPSETIRNVDFIVEELHRRSGFVAEREANSITEASPPYQQCIFWVQRMARRSFQNSKAMLWKRHRTAF
jgi:hypothetical protein